MQIKSSKLRILQLPYQDPIPSPNYVPMMLANEFMMDDCNLNKFTSSISKIVKGYFMSDQYTNSSVVVNKPELSLKLAINKNTE